MSMEFTGPMGAQSKVNRDCWKSWRLWIVLGSLACGLSDTQAAETAANPKSQLNVLLIVADDLNCRLGCYGDPQVKTPQIDRLARRGVVFERAYCQFPLCSPSRSSFLTGRRPNATGVLKNPGPAPTAPGARPSPHFRDTIPDTVTWPQLFRNHGYFVARVGKLYHYGVPGQIGTNGLDDPESWEQVINPKGRDKLEEDKIFSLIPNNFGGTLSWLAAEGTDAEQTDGLTAAAAVKLLAHKQERPFFLAVGFFRPHTPYVAPKAYFEKYPTTAIQLAELSSEDRARRPAPAFASAKPEQEQMSDDQRREAIQAYQAAITFMDAQVGIVLDGLEREGLTDKTIVVFCSDHGYHLHEHGLWQKMSLFEGSARVPLIIAAPGQAGNGKATQSLAELVDLYPTVADLAGLQAPEYLDGVSLRPVLEDPEKTAKTAAVTQVRRGNFDGYSIRTERFRLTLWDEGRKGTQLYDLNADPAETKNLAELPEHAAVVAELKSRLQKYTAPPGK